MYAVVEVSAGHYIASIEFRDNFYMAESLDFGESWDYVGSNFGEADGGGIIIIQSVELSEKMHALAYDNETGMLFATGFNVLASSNDLGRTWHILSGEWQGFAKGFSALTIDPHGAAVWIGGQNAIEQSQLYSYDLSSQVLSEHSSMTDMNGEPGTVKNIRFHPDEPSTIYASGEPGIIFSDDAGKTWRDFYLNEDSKFYFGLLIDSIEPSRMYTAGWVKAFEQPQPFLLEISTNGGDTWSVHEFESTEAIYGGVWSMYAEHTEAQSNLYFGLFKGGIMSVSIDKSN
ncbi:hypothetical protein KIU71_11620 [Alteromonas sp. SM 2104]|nr:hypothetical protein [Alteromonas oceanisediminis]